MPKQHGFTGDTAPPEGSFVNATKLPFHKPVIIAKLLFLDQTESIIGILAAGSRAVNTWPIVFPFQVFRRAKDRNAKPAANADAWTSITCHTLNLRFEIGHFCELLDAAFLAWTTAVVRDRRHVFDRSDFEADRL